MSKKQKPHNRPDDPEKVAAKQARRTERKAREAAEKKAKARIKRIKTGVGVALLVVVLSAGGFVLYRELFPRELPGVTAVPSEGRVHLAAGQSATYSSATPTSGDHSQSSPQCGIYRDELPLELAIHALEHGSVILWHRPDLPAEDLNQLRELVNSHDEQLILAPSAEIESPIVATAWNRLKPYEGFIAEIEEFVETYRHRGPERVSCSY